MARQIRIEYPDAFYHVINRGYMQMWIFHDSQDFERFKNDLLLVFHSHSLVVHAFCIMNNHLHLFVETPLGNLSKAMHRLFSRYAAYYKKKYSYKGKVFEKRYTAYLVETELYALDLTRYIHQNPVDVIVSDPLSWQHSSYRVYQGLSEKPDFMDLDLVLKRFDKEKRQAISKMKEHMFRDESSQWYPEDYILGNTILGSSSFLERIRDKIPLGDKNELSGLTLLNEDHKIAKIQEYLSKQALSLEQRIDLFVYAARKRTTMNTNKINKVLGTRLDRHSIYYRIKKVESEAKKNLSIAKVVIDLKTI